VGSNRKEQFLFLKKKQKKQAKTASSEEPLVGFLAFVVRKLWPKNNQLYN